MANVKITQLPTTTTIEDNDLIAVVTGMDSTPTTEHITKFDFAASIASSPLATNPVENTFADIASMLADQSNQTTSFFQFVLDATADPNITVGSAYYEKLASTTSNLSLDYRLLSQSEAEVLESNQAYKTFIIEAIQDDATPLTTVGGGRISFEYSGANVTAILFNKEYTTALANFYGSDVNIRFYNRTTKLYEKESIATANWTTVNTDYARGAVSGASIQIANLTIGDSVEFSVTQSSGSGGATAEWGGISGTLSSQTDLQAALDAKQGDITLTTTGTAGAATFDGTTLNVPIYPSGVGDVVKSGTPVNNQIGVWIGDGIIEGDSSIIVDASSVTINPAIIDNAILSLKTNGEARLFSVAETRIESNLAIEFGTPITDGIADTMEIDVNSRTVTLLSYAGGLAGTALYSLSIDSTGKIITTPISLESVVAGTNVTIDATDPSNPIINVSGLGINPDYIDFNALVDPNPTYVKGRMFYNIYKKTMAVYSDEPEHPAINFGRDNFVRVYNSSGGTLSKGDVVSITGVFFSTALAQKAIATDADLSDKVCGIMSHDLINGEFGWVQKLGDLDDIDTTGLTAGDILYLSETVSGGYQTTKPSAANSEVIVGQVGKVNATTGTIFCGLRQPVSSFVKSNTTGEPTGSDVVVNMVSLTQAEYDAGTPVATTFYVITD